MTNLEVSLFIHITAAIVGLGVTFAEAFTYPVAMRLDKRHLPYKHSFQRAINTLLALPALVVVLATGLYLTDELGYQLGDLWLSGALTIVVVLVLMLLLYFIPEDKRLQAMAERDLDRGGERRGDDVGGVHAAGANRGRRGHVRRPAGDRGRLPDGHEARPLTPM